MRKRYRLIVGAVLLGLSVPCAASMNAEEFYQRATKVKKKGPLAMFSMKEVKALVAEVRAAGTKVKETRLAAERSGKKGRYCPPDPPKQMGHEEYYAGIASIPQAERRRIDLVEATTLLLAAKFPCKS